MTQTPEPTLPALQILRDRARFAEQSAVLALRRASQDHRSMAVCFVHGSPEYSKNLDLMGDLLQLAYAIEQLSGGVRV